MGKTTELRREIKKSFIPFAESQGYKSTMQFAPTTFDFIKKTDKEILVFDIQWEKYGFPRFVVNFGKCAKHEVENILDLYSAKEINPAITPIKGRLQPKKGFTTASWFRQDKNFFIKLISSNKNRPATEVVNQLMELFVEIEEYFINGTIGEHFDGAHEKNA
jgi:hypothetical protein